MRIVVLSRKSAFAAGALCVLAGSAGLASTANADPSAVVQYSAAVPATDQGDPSTGAGPGAAEDPRLPTIPREVFTRVPERDVYALAMFAISPELGGVGGIAGVTAPPYRGPGQSYPADGIDVADALPSSLGDAGTLVLTAVLAAMLGAAIASRRAVA